MTAPPPEPLETETRGFDSALGVADVWSAKLARQLFRLGIYVTLPALVALVTTDVVLRYVRGSRRSSSGGACSATARGP
jgi:hypothetical protein